MKAKIRIDQVRAKLKKRGFSGLVVPGECGCTVDDLAPCGECQQENGEEFINGCEPGYVFQNPDKTDEWMVRAVNEEPDAEAWRHLV